jgi:predicted DNA-binding ribbon-helix-helix protein
MAPSRVIKRSIVIGQHKTSVSLEAEFWDCFKRLAYSRGLTLSQLASRIDENRIGQGGNLSSALRVFVLDYYREQFYASTQGGRTQDHAR